MVWWEYMEPLSERRPKAPRPGRSAMPKAAVTIPATSRSAAGTPVMSRTVVVAIASAVIGGLVGGAVVSFSVLRPSTLRKPPAATLPSAPSSDARSQQASAGSEWSTPLSSAKQLADAGRLREAQEEYLSILLVEPRHEEAMHGLVRVVGLIAKGDRAALRRQAAEYRRAVELGIETEEHYTAPAMELLARASLQAAGERVPSVPPTPVSTPGAGTAQVRVRSRPEKSPQPSTTQSQRPPGRDVPATPTPVRKEPPGATATTQGPTSPEARGPLTTLQIGPVSGAVATEILGELTLAGFTARVSSRSTLQVFRVLSEPLRADIAPRRASELTAAGLPARVRSLPGGLAQLDLGAYPTAEGAEAVVRKVRAKGLVVSAQREGGSSQLITVGPHPKDSIDEVVRALRAKFRAVRFVVVRAE